MRQGIKEHRKLIIYHLLFAIVHLSLDVIPVQEGIQGRIIHRSNIESSGYPIKDPRSESRAGFGYDE
jgi:hypothetical protein